MPGKEHNNWYKVDSGIKETSKGLHDVVEKDIVQLHNSLRAKLACHGVCLSNCSKTKCLTKWCSTCKQWKNELKKNNLGLETIPWKMTDSAFWPRQPWEMAKVFVPTCLRSRKAVNSVTDLDITALTAIILNCKAVTGLSKKKVRVVRIVRNDYIGHNTGSEVKSFDMTDAFQKMRSLLQEPRISSTSSGKTALVKVNDWETKDVSLQKEEYHKTKCMLRFIFLCGCAFAFAFWFMPPWVLPYIKLNYCKWGQQSQDACLQEIESCLPSPTKEISFLSTLKGHKDFVQRQWILDEIGESIVNTKGVILQGPLATGKTVMAVAIICSSKQIDTTTKLLPTVLAYHFCQFDNKNTQDPVTFIRNMADLIASRLYKYAEFIVEHEDVQNHMQESICRQDIQLCFEKVILGPLNKLTYQSSHNLLVLDGLDECKQEQNMKNEIAMLIRDSLPYFPDWLKIVATSRDVHQDIVPTYPLKYVTLNPKDPRHLSDIKLATARFCSKRNISQNNMELLQNYISNKSQGNFYHASMLQVDCNKDSVHARQNVTDDVFLRNFERNWGKNGEHYAIAKSVFEVQLASGYPKDFLEFYEIINEHRIEIHLFFDFDIRNMSLLISQDLSGKYRFIHQSLAQWLITTKSWAHIDTKEGHRKLARYMLRKVEEDFYEVDFLQLLSHLAEAYDPTLTTCFMMLSRNKIQKAIKARHDLWKESNPKIIELFLYHWHTNFSVKEALFWSTVAGNPASVIAFLNYDPNKAYQYMNSSDYLIPFYTLGNIGELAEHLHDRQTAISLKDAIDFHLETVDKLVLSRDMSMQGHGHFYNYIASQKYPSGLQRKQRARCYTNLTVLLEREQPELSKKQYDIYKSLDQPGDQENIRENENLFYIALATGNNLLVNVFLQHRPVWIKNYKLEFLLNISRHVMPPSVHHTYEFLDSIALNIASLTGFSKMVWKLTSVDDIPDPWVYCYSRKEDLGNKNKIRRCSSALHLAVLKGHSEIVKILDSVYPQLLYEKDLSNVTPIELAVKMNHTRVAEFLIKKAVELVHTTTGRNILHEVFIFGNTKLIEILINKNESLIYERDNLNFLPVQYAVLHGDILSFEVIGSRLQKDDGRILYTASFSGCYRTVEYLIKQGFSNIWWNETFEGGLIQLNVSALHTAVVNNFTDIVTLLLDKFPELRHGKAHLTFNRNLFPPWTVPSINSMINNLASMVDEVMPFLQTNKKIADSGNIQHFDDKQSKDTIISGMLLQKDTKLKKKFRDTFPRLVEKELKNITKSIWVPLEKGVIYIKKTFDRKKNNDFQNIYETYIQLHILQKQYAITLSKRLSKLPLLNLKPLLFESKEYLKYKKACDSLHHQLRQDVSIDALDFAIALNLTNVVDVLLSGDHSMSNQSVALAIEKGHIHLISDRNQKSYFTGFDKTLSPLLSAKSGQLNVLQHFWNGSLDNGPEIMNSATIAGHGNIVQFLIDQGVQMITTCKGIRGVYCTNPLHEATLGQHFEIVKILLKQFPKEIDSKLFKISNATLI